MTPRCLATAAGTEEKRTIVENVMEVLTISKEDPHPSALGHSLVGEYYVECLLGKGLLK